MQNLRMVLLHTPSGSFSLSCFSTYIISTNNITEPIVQTLEDQTETAIRAVIVDDERGGRLVLQKMLEEYCEEVNIIGIADSAEAGKQTIEMLHPDLVFLDIEMPYQNGFEMLESIRARNFDVVFVTAHESYASKAEKYSSFGLLLKPFDRAQLKRAISWHLNKD